MIASLGRSTRPPSEGRRVPPADLLKLLQNAEHRLLGSADDLQDVLLEELEWIARAPLRSSIHGAELWSGGGFGPEDSLLNIFVSIAICVGLWILARRAGQLRQPIGPQERPE